MKVLTALFLTVLTIIQAEEFSEYTPNDLFVIPDKLAPYNPKVVGGNEARRHSYPHSVALYIGGSSFCGGSIISKDVVLTAAHCVDRGRIVKVVAGAHNLRKFELTQQKRWSANIVVHPDWDRASLTNDIALVKFNTSLKLNRAVQPIALDNGHCLSADLDGTPGTLSGWGRYGSSSRISSVLREVTNPILPNDECKKWYSVIKETHICLNASGGKSSCNGDSGGALLGSRNGSKVEVGIVSFGSAAGCASGYPSAYTRVACFSDWIKKNM